MNKIDGLELLKRVRGSEKFKDIPFFLMTATENQYVFEVKNKANGFLLKLISFQNAHSMLQRLFPERKFPKVPAQYENYGGVRD